MILKLLELNYYCILTMKNFEHLANYWRYA